MGLFEGLTVPAKQVLARATEAAAAMGSHEVEGAHLLLGLLEAGETSAGRLLAERLPDRARVAAEAKRVTLPSRDGAHPGFGEEACLVLAAAKGISAGRGEDRVGTGACLLAMLTLVPRSIEELLRAFDVDGEELRAAASCLDDGAEPMDPPPGATTTWTVTVGGEGPFSWDDNR